MFIIKKLYNYHSQNISDQFIYLNDYMHTFDHQPINQLNQPSNIDILVYNISQQSSYSSTIIWHYHLYDLFILKWSTFDHIKKVSNQNWNLEDQIQNFSCQLIDPSN